MKTIKERKQCDYHHGSVGKKTQLLQFRFSSLN